MPKFNEILKSGIPFCVLRYYCTELITGRRERYPLYQMIALTNAHSLMLGFKPECEMRRYHREIAYRDMTSAEVREFRQMKGCADSHESDDDGAIWRFNGFNYKRNASHRE